MKRAREESLFHCVAWRSEPRILEAQKQAAWSMGALRAAYPWGLGLTVDKPGSLEWGLSHAL